MVGVVGFVLLLALMRLDLLRVWPLGWLRLMLLVVLGLLLSARSGRAWALGRPPESGFTRKIQPTVDVRGQAGSTYLLLEPAKGGKAKVRPREFSPGWWAFYTAIVRAPVALGDFILTIFWRLSSGWIAAGGPLTNRPRGSEGERELDYTDQPGDFRSPDTRRF